LHQIDIRGSETQEDLLYDVLDLRQHGGLQRDVVRVQQVQPELVEEHLVAVLVAAVVVRVLLLDAVVGQVAGHVLQVGAVVGLGGRPQNALPVQVDVVLMVHEHPAPKRHRIITY